MEGRVGEEEEGEEEGGRLGIGKQAGGWGGRREGRGLLLYSGDELTLLCKRPKVIRSLISSPLPRHL